MRKIKLGLSIFAFAIAFMSCNSNKREIKNVIVEEIAIDSTSIRAIHTAKDSTMIYATSDGYIGLVFPNNKILKSKQATYDTIIPHFRAIASTKDYIYALSVGNPALLYQYQNDSLKIVYKEEHQKVFYDAMAFFDENSGIAMGDPTDDCLSIILTHDGGNTWNKIPCSKLPKVEESEAAFAASNTNIAIIGNNAWIATGGKKARVFHTPDKGENWEVYETPITQGEQMTGIYSIDFYDVKNGIVIGGNWNEKDNNKANKATTNDGGKTWQLVADGEEPGYKSCVQYVPNTNGKEIVAVGTTGISFSRDGGNSWQKVSDKQFYTIKFVNENFAWLAGNSKIGKLIFE